MGEDSLQFKKWRSFFWPVHRRELKKFLPMLLMFFLISFNYNILRTYKDTVIVTASNSGAETLAFIKLWAVLPSALFMTFLYTRLSHSMNRERVFYIIMAIFLSFFFLFAFVLYPSQEQLHPNNLADQLQQMLPQGCKGLIAIFRNWTYTLFYVMAELWSTTIFTVLFWGFANEVTSVGEARRFYGLLGTGGNLAGIFAGQAAFYFSGNLFCPWIPYGKNAWDQSILFLTGAILFAGFMTMFIFQWLNKHAIRPQECAGKLKEKKPKMSLKHHFHYLARSKYLICIALIVIGYNLALNLVEIVWKNQMKLLYPNPNDYNSYMGLVTTVMSIIATVSGLFTTSGVIRRYSWTTSAMIPPIIVGTTGIAFFALIIVQQWNLPWFTLVFGMTPLMLSVTLGSLQNCLSRASKYTIFDATKEMSFIPLDTDAKMKGKAAIDGIGSRLGKSGGSVIHQGLLLVFATLSASAPYVAAIFLAAIVVWGASVAALGKQFDALTQKTPVPEDPTKPLMAKTS